MVIYTYDKLTPLVQLVVLVLQSQLDPVYPALQRHSPTPVSLLHVHLPFGSKILVILIT